MSKAERNELRLSLAMDDNDRPRRLIPLPPRCHDAVDNLGRGIAWRALRRRLAENGERNREDAEKDGTMNEPREHEFALRLSEIRQPRNVDTNAVMHYSHDEDNRATTSNSLFQWEPEISVDQRAMSDLI